MHARSLGRGCDIAHGREPMTGRISSEPPPPGSSVVPVLVLLLALLLLAAFLAAAALTVTAMAALAATGWAPAAVAVSIVAFQLLFLVVVLAGRALRRLNAAVALIASGILLA